MTVDVYSCYYKAEAECNGVARRAALVKLTADSESGNITYTISASFFPHENEEDFGVSWDMVIEKKIFEGKGRRSKKRETLYMETIEEELSKLASEKGAEIFWDEPLAEARLG